MISHRISGNAGYPSLLTALTLLLGLAVCTPHYDTMDDIVLRMWVSGYLPHSQPGGFTLFMNSAWSGAVAGLYRLFPAFPWYDLTLLAVGSAACYFLYRAMLGENPSRLRLLLTALAAALFAFYFSQFQYTTLAALIGGSAIVSGVSTLHASVHARTALGWMFCGIVLAGLIRFESLELAAVFAAPAALPLLWRAPRRALLRIAAVAAAAFAVSGALYQWNESHYHADPQWSHVRDMHRIIYPMVEYTPLLNTMPPRQADRLFAEITGWDSAAVYLYRTYFYTHPMFSYAQQQHAYEKFRPVLSEQKSRMLRETRWGKLFLYHASTLLPLIFILLLTGLLPLRQDCFLYAIYLSLWMILLCMALDRAMKPPPPRVYLALMAPALGFLLLLNNGKKPGMAKLHWLQPFIALLLGACVVTTVYPYSGLTGELKRKRAQVAGDLQMLKKRFPSQRYVYTVWANHFPFHFWMFPLHSTPTGKSFHIDFLTGAASQTPYAQGRFAAYGIDTLEEALCTRPDMLLITYSPDWVLPAFVHRYYGVDASMKTVFKGRMLRVKKCTVRK